MNFELITSGYFYSQKEKEALEKLGFRFKLDTSKKNISYCKEEDSQIELNSLEDLMNLVKDYGDVIVSIGRVEIYDNYRE